MGASSASRRAWLASNQPGYALYAATKAGVEAMTHVFAKKVGSRGITVNAAATWTG